MSFEVRTTVAGAGGRLGDTYQLYATDGSVRAEIWPQWGFNCLRWQVAQDGRWGDILFAARDWEDNPVPTRSGHPILFPFPGRLRNGSFQFEGRSYSLPLNDSTRHHAIHGLTPGNRWRVVGTSVGDRSASVTGEFHLAKDLPSALGTWPADFRLRITYSLSLDRLRVEADLQNLGIGNLPFGIGYHPYFRLPVSTESEFGEHVLQSGCSELWEAEHQLPTGRRVPIPRAIDFRRPRAIADVALDHVLTGLPPDPHGSDGLVELARLSHNNIPGFLQVVADPAFRELVLFVPPHRQAIAIEPYTCAADAANLAERGVDSGWRVIPGGTRWTSTVEYRWVAVRT
jgi:aldose 1-epimerase